MTALYPPTHTQVLLVKLFWCGGGGSDLIKFYFSKCTAPYSSISASPGLENLLSGWEVRWTTGRGSLLLSTLPLLLFLWDTIIKVALAHSFMGYSELEKLASYSHGAYIQFLFLTPSQSAVLVISCLGKVSR